MSRINHRTWRSEEKYDEFFPRAARSRGMKATFEFSKGFPADVKFPAIVGVRLSEIGHFIAILGREGDSFSIGDPLRGGEILTLEELEARYQFTGFCLSVEQIAVGSE